MHMDMQRICINVSHIKGHVAVAHLWMHVEVLRTQASWHASATWTLLILSILTVGWCMCAVGCQACIMLVLVQCINRSAPTATGVSVGQLCLRPFNGLGPKEVRGTCRCIAATSGNLGANSVLPRKLSTTKTAFRSRSFAPIAKAAWTSSCRTKLCGSCSCASLG